MRVRHESGVAPVDYELRSGANVYATGTIGDGETQFVNVPDGVAGVRAVLLNGVINLYGGTASTNSTPCPVDTTTSTTSARPARPARPAHDQHDQHDEHQYNEHHNSTKHFDHARHRRRRQHGGDVHNTRHRR